MSRRTASRRGFTLIESIVALTLAAAGFAAIYQLYAGSANAERAATEMVFVSRLADTILSDPAIDPEGVSQGYRWRLEASPSPAQTGLDTLTLIILTPAGREVQVVTERASPTRQENAP